LGATKDKNIILANDNDEKRMLFENCRLKAKRVVNPIIDWADEDVYGFLEDAKVPMNPLYAEGQCRVGCIGCPLAKRESREAEFARWPKYKQLYVNAFERMLEERKRRGKLDGSWRMGTLAEDVFRWWMEYDVLPGQTSMEDFQ
jgi:phosphoadenosine phosphosulfate reductase